MRVEVALRERERARHDRDLVGVVDRGQTEREALQPQPAGQRQDAGERDARGRARAISSRRHSATTFPRLGRSPARAGTISSSSRSSCTSGTSMIAPPASIGPSSAAGASGTLSAACGRARPGVRRCAAHVRRRNRREQQRRIGRARPGPARDQTDERRHRRREQRGDKPGAGRRPARGAPVDPIRAGSDRRAATTRRPWRRARRKRRHWSTPRPSRRSAGRAAGCR